ncbi:MAG: hypothetical protein NWE92_02935 [Candidatus Bathyarchaeota archaeon]|nr:hypothetical protein [Candidatus Bathyarchaeota archaeon]
MGGKRVLFIGGPLGLGHVGRDLEIVRALRRKIPDAEIVWLCEEPASMVLEKAGEQIHPDSKLLGKGNIKLGNMAENYRVNMVKWTMNMRRDWAANAKVVSDLTQRECFDLVVGDERYEIIVAMSSDSNFKTFPFVIIYDFIGIDNVTGSPIDAFSTYMVNRIWAKGMQSKKTLADLSLFVGEPEDVPDRKFGFMLPNRRLLAERTLKFLGYILPFKPDQYRDKFHVRELLGYGMAPLVVCSIGGTSAGKKLLDLCTAAYPIIKRNIPDLLMVLVCGPMVDPKTIKAPQGIDVKSYVPDLYKHMAAADLCIVAGGGTATLELTALQKPFLYFPLEGHFEQEVPVASRCARHRAGIKMDFSKTTPEILSDAILVNLNSHPVYATIPLGGEEKAAELLSKLLVDVNA